MKISISVLVLSLLVALPILAKTSTKELVRDLRYGTPDKREAAIDQLSREANRDSSDALIEVLPETEGMLRLKVISALGASGGASAVPALVEMLGNPEADTRLQAARALGRIGNPAASSGLRKSLKDVDFEVRAEAAEALGRCGSAEAVEPLTGMLADKHRIVRLSAVDALGYLGDPGALEPLVGMLDEKDPVFRRHVVKAVGSLKDSEKILDTLGIWLTSKDSYLRGFSAEALGSRGRIDRMVKALVNLLDDPVLPVRVRAAEALGAWKAVEAVPALKAYLRDSSDILRWKACNALGEIGDPSSIEALKYTADNDSNDEVKRVAADAVIAINAR